MNYLALCNSLHEKTGESGGPLITTVNQSGYYLEITNYIKDAWLDIQLKHPAWRFLRRQAAPLALTGNNLVDADAWVGANLAGAAIDEYHKSTFSIYETVRGTKDETPLTYVPWERWKAIFGLNYDDGKLARPIHVTIEPYSGILQIGATPDKDYTVTFEFAQQAIELTVDTDTPRISPPLHDIIVWNALEHYAMAEESQAQVVRARRYYSRYLNRLQRRELPEISITGPLA